MDILDQPQANIDNNALHGNQDGQPGMIKSKDSSVEHAKNLKNYIENYKFKELNDLLENENIQKKTLNTGLWLALQNCRGSEEMLEIIQILLKHGAEPDCYLRYFNKTPNPKIDEKDNVTILMYACLKSDIPLINLILDYKPDINLKDKNNKNALFYAILSDKGENLDVIEILLKNGIEVNCSGKVEYSKNNYIIHSPLSLAVSNNMKDTFDYLVRNGGDINFKTQPDEYTPLHIAVMNGNMDIISIILNTPGALLEENNRDGKKPKDLALRHAPTDIYNIIIEKIKEIKQIKDENGEQFPTEENIQNRNQEQIYLSQQQKHQHPNLQSNIMLQPQPVNEAHLEQIITETANYPIQANQHITVTTNNNYIIDSTPSSQSMPHDEENSNQWEVKDNINIINGTNDNYPPIDNTYMQNIDTAHNDTNNQKYKLNLAKLKRNQFKKEKPRAKNSNVLQIPLHFSKTILPYNKLNCYINMSTQPTLTVDLSENATEVEIKYLNKLKEKDALIKRYESEHEKQKEKIDMLKKEILDRDRRINEAESKYSANCKSISDQFEALKKDNMELNNGLNHYKELYSKCSINDIMANPQGANFHYYLQKKFINFVYSEVYILNCLTKDLIDYQQFVKGHIEMEQNIYDILQNLIQEAVSESIPNYEVQLYGSHATNLCLPWSDLDIVLVPKKQEFSYNANTNVLLSNLFEVLKQKNWVHETKYIPSANIPIIKLVSQDKYHSIPIDISIQDDKHFGLKCVELVKSFLDQYESLKPLVLTLKNILKEANLNDPYKGGLSSYGLILMIVSFLQIQRQMNKDISPSDNNLGRLFYEFVNYYGLQFKTENYIIHARTDEDSTEDPIFQSKMGNELVIVDPLNKNNNVAKSCFQYVNVKMTFIICIISLKEDCECGCHYMGSGQEYNHLTIDHCFLKRIFNSVKRFHYK